MEKALETAKKIAIVVLVVGMNVAMGLVQFEIVAPASKGMRVANMCAWLASNLLAFLWRGVTPKPGSGGSPMLLLIASAVGFAFSLSACGDPLLQCDKTSITVATTTAKGYKVVDLVDEYQHTKIREEARAVARAAQAKFDEWREHRGVAFKVFDGGVAVVEGYTAARPELAKAIDKKKAAAPWIAALLKAASATAAKLAELEVIQGGAR
jgi:hypothetical protein